MCGRFSLYATESELEVAYGVGLPGPLAPRWNIAPGQNVVVVRAGARGREVALLQWGLVPAWARDPSIGRRLINARSETAADKPAFRQALRTRRCVIPASGFYEWSKGSDKRPFHFSRADGAPCALAGIWEHWRDGAETDLWTCAILTADANADVADVHGRMPLVLEPGMLDCWLGGSARDARALLRPPHAGMLRRLAVTRAVNDPRVDGPACLEPAADQSDESIPQDSTPAPRDEGERTL